MPRTIEQQIKSTYFALRVGAATIAFIFPLLLWGGGKVAGFTLRDSMSAYYWATPVQLALAEKTRIIPAKDRGLKPI